MPQLSDLDSTIVFCNNAAAQSTVNAPRHVVEIAATLLQRKEARSSGMGTMLAKVSQAMRTPRAARLKGVEFR